MEPDSIVADSIVADSIVADSIVADSIVQSVVKRFLDRSALGQKKYGTTLDRTDLKTLDWILHAQEELMDGILYLERLKKEMAVGEKK